MKAIINGITVEGTPEEIAQYQRIKAQEAIQYKPPTYSYQEWCKTHITCDTTSNYKP